MRDHGEQEAFFAAQYPRLAGWAAGLLGDDDAGRDVAAESFARLLPRWNRVDDRAGYLYVTAANVVRDRWRRASTQRRSLSLLARSGPDAHAAPDHGLRDLVDRLPDRTRVPVLLHYYADMTAEDIARHLGKPAGTVRRHLAEGRASLRHALEECPT